MMIRRFLQIRTGVVLVGASLVVAGSLAACGSDVSETTTAAGSGGSTSIGVGGTSGVGGAPGTGGSTSTVADTVASSTTGSGSDVCVPGQMDGMCLTCIKEKCCTELEACEADTTCKCFRECKATPDGMGMAGTQACIMKCGDPGQLNQAIRQCRNMECSMNCMGGGMTGGGGMAGSGGSGGGN